MTGIVIPQLDANSETVKLVRWEVEDGAGVSRGDVLCTVETSKAIFEVEAEAPGLVVRVEPEGAMVAFNVPIGYVVADEAEAGRVRSGYLPAEPAEGSDEAAFSATKRAVQLARQHNVDLAKVPSDGIITESDVQGYLKAAGRLAGERMKPGELPDAVRRVLVIGAGYGAMQVIDILLNYPDVRVAGCVDDDAKLHGTEIFGAPVIGPIGELETYWKERRFDCAIIAISTNIGLRVRFFNRCAELGIPMINAIDPTVRVNRGAVIGTGNIICSQCHIGVAARIGDNNFISAHNSIDHHNVWGSHITTGPNCATSGAVTVGSEVKFGTGVFVQPNLSIGAGSIIASGAIIIRSIPERHAVKVKVTTEVVAL
ncbi:MAG TPA: biotin/lipoyl-containing protein [Candidatus Kapabacteria bacterium]|nr:biotin/lipoyl-containing protein [Candidatus Kapabacteria bacterium]